MQSTYGAVKAQLPSLGGADLGFTLPEPPTTTAQAVHVMHTLRRHRGRLPTFHDYYSSKDGLCQHRLVHAVLKLILQCLDVWSADPSNKNDTVFTLRPKELRTFQICPIAIGFKNLTMRNDAYRRWYNSLEANARSDVRDAMHNEIIADGTVTECTYGHRVKSANLYLVSSHPSSVLGVIRQDLVVANHGDAAAPKQYLEVAVLIARFSKNIYIYDPLFEIKEWVGEPKRLADMPMLGRVKQLLQYLQNCKDTRLDKATIIIGGGGGGGVHESRERCVSWIVEVVCKQWMALDGPHVAKAAPLYFDPGCDQAEIRW